jgi:geranylgeranyl diphosphate synthase, type I
MDRHSAVRIGYCCNGYEFSTIVPAQPSHPQSSLYFAKGSIVKNWYFATFVALLTDIEQNLHDFIVRWPQVTPLFWEMVNHHFGWSQGGGETGGKSGTILQNLSGKRIRPLLTLLVARALTGRHDHVLPAALGIEIVHNFTLVHDDVMDKSLERRHRETLWAKWGSSQAVNAGDGLYALGMSALLDLGAQDVPPAKIVEAMRLLLDACVATVEGQMLDVGFEQQIDVSPEAYLQMIENKSGALIGCSTQMGALLSTADAVVIDAYAEFGRSLGIAFQIWDDYLGIWGQAETMGKSATSDIEGKKKSYPVLVAFKNADPQARRTLETIYQKDVIQSQEIEQVLEILTGVNAADETHRMIDVYYQRALDALDSVGVDNEDQRNLRELANFLVERAY